MGVHPKLSSLTHPSTMNRLVPCYLESLAFRKEELHQLHQSVHLQYLRPAFGTDHIVHHHHLLEGWVLIHLLFHSCWEEVVQEVLLILFFLYCCLGEVKAVSEV